MQDAVHCPKCGSTSITPNKKGFSGKKAVAGAVLTGGIGLLAGTIGSNRITITCLSCGNTFKPGHKPKTVSYPTNQYNPNFRRPLSKSHAKVARVLSIIFASIFGFISLIMTLAYFNLEKSNAKDGAGVGVLILIAITVLFIYMAKKNKRSNT